MGKKSYLCAPSQVSQRGSSCPILGICRPIVDARSGRTEKEKRFPNLQKTPTTRQLNYFLTRRKVILSESRPLNEKVRENYARDFVVASHNENIHSKTIVKHEISSNGREKPAKTYYKFDVMSSLCIKLCVYRASLFFVLDEKLEDS